MTHHFLFDGNYTYSVDKDDDSNERDPFTFRYANLYDLKAEYTNSDRDERHKFNFYMVGDLPWGLTGNIRMQAHSTICERTMNSLVWIWQLLGHF